jgi:small-conductance mechanosensitive channel
MNQPPGPSEAAPAGSLLDTVILGATLQQWALATLAGLAVCAIVLVARRILQARARAFADRRSTGLIGLVPQLILKTSRLVAPAAGVLAGSMWLDIGPHDDAVVRGVIVVVLAVQAILWGRVLIDFGLAEFLRRRTAAAGLSEPDGAMIASVGVLRVMALIALYAGAIIVALDNFHVEVTAMIAGLGIGGIAIALAAQNILGDLFGSLSIVLDKPFVVGDFIIVGDKLGTVEKIGLKTTRVRALSGEQLVFANTDLLSSRIQNFKRMNERRVVFSIHVPHQTPAEKLEQIPAVLKEAVLRLPEVRFDRAHFKAVGPHSMEFEVVYYVLSRDYAMYMDKQQAINLFIVRRFAEMGVRFAYPTQTLYVADGSIRLAGQLPDAPGGNGAPHRGPTAATPAG